MKFWHAAPDALVETMILLLFYYGDYVHVVGCLTACTWLSFRSFRAVIQLKQVDPLLEGIRGACRNVLFARFPAQ